MRSRSQHTEAGFTLVELVVATTLISIVMAGVYTALSTAVQAWKYGEADYAVYDDARYALGRMTRELQAIPAVAQRWFIGSDDELQFITLAPPMNVEDGAGARVIQVTYKITGRDPRKGRTLVREERLVKSALPSEYDCEDQETFGRMQLGRKHTFVLAYGVKDFRLDYYWVPPRDRRPPNTPPPWVDMIKVAENKSCWGLPQSVSLHLRLANADGVSSPRDFDATVAFRARTSGLPTELAEIYHGTR